MARPKKDDELKKKHAITFKLNDDEYETFQKLAEEAGLTKAQLARAAANGIEKIAISDDLLSEARKISTQCAQIGNLLRLHATLIEVIAQHPSLNSQDKEVIADIRRMLVSSKKRTHELKMCASDISKQLHLLSGK